MSLSALAAASASHMPSQARGFGPAKTLDDFEAVFRFDDITGCIRSDGERTPGGGFNAVERCRFELGG